MSTTTGSSGTVFLSHASEDKEAFARPLARALLKVGVRVWLDEWEIKGGDSLVAKIFDAGLKEAQAVVILISSTSVTKPWVEKELSVAIVRSIGERIRIIPVRVDDTAVPTALSDLVWLDWNERAGAKGMASEIASIIHDIDRRPALGEIPRYLQDATFEIPGLAKQDIHVLKLIYEVAKVRYREIVQNGEVLPLAEKLGMSLETLNGSFEVLLDSGEVWDKGGSRHRGHFAVELPVSTFLALAAEDGEPVEACRLAVAVIVVNEGGGSSGQISDGTGFPHFLVKVVLEQLADEQLLKIVKLRNTIEARFPSEKLKRWVLQAKAGGG